jgi:hypothetical protein
VVVAALLFGMMSVAKRRRAQAAQRALDRRISHVVREAEWVHDEASLDFVGDEDTRQRMHDLGTDATALADDAPDEQLRQELQALCYALDLLADALDTTAPAATEAVEECRHDLMVAIMPLSRRV